MSKRADKAWLMTHMNQVLEYAHKHSRLSLLAQYGITHEQIPQLFAEQLGRELHNIAAELHNLHLERGRW